MENASSIQTEDSRTTIINRVERSSEWIECARWPRASRPALTMTRCRTDSLLPPPSVCCVNAVIVASNVKRDPYLSHSTATATTSIQYQPWFGRECRRCCFHHDPRGTIQRCYRALVSSAAALGPLSCAT
jgi:hypothetical protein